LELCYSNQIRKTLPSKALEENISRPTSHEIPYFSLEAARSKVRICLDLQILSKLNVDAAWFSKRLSLVKIFVLDFYERENLETIQQKYRGQLNISISRRGLEVVD
jgi:hypothetical protein